MEAKGHICVSMISHSRTVDFDVSLSLFPELASLNGVGWNSSLFPHIGNADLGGARNAVFTLAQSVSAFSHLAQLDNDVSWPPGTLQRLLAWNVDLILGAYPKRSDAGGYSVLTMPDGVKPDKMVDPHTGKHRADGLLKVLGGPAGLMVMSRNCMDRMAEAYKDRWYIEPRLPNGRAYSVFEFSVENNDRIGEDAHFCKLWRAIGGDVWVDPHLHLSHHGTKTYQGCFADYLRTLQLNALSVVEMSPVDATK